ncbi:hypothetical protein Kpol_1000p26 [Vanderwaltozyma polyspora DSM 70294]|uniref:SPIN90/Ldb17 leucine-rich domain-containing protein n=1 Tax=Vanderwaltozyma polyspora (strain ATCC 22028 / DSM 70294 / BCRC 21397 / CBS 2163 / NBRC 10782 / NRRL Y-8283 / UCD 57-17) TaxID=436907 RepID=A7TPW5_VANPO|nr:uncharacterized protein Kpol_1000p26 [Vanderwaltozyma polyspora DSM 70294]EDO15713.1 hypothetical protein Kpol_1000p26 [Vanderwaltozyma polyspora DSM 70294]
MEQLEDFINNYDYSKQNEVEYEILYEICMTFLDIIQTLPRDMVIKLLNIFSTFSLGMDKKSSICFNTLNQVLGCADDANSRWMLHGLIDHLQPLLLKCSNSGKTEGLRPNLGFSIKNDDLRTKWLDCGGLQSIPLFYTILRFMKRNEISSNLWWITPGILNLLDDTTDLERIKLGGVKLLQVLLEHTFAGSVVEDERWMSFPETGLFKLYEPILINMTYYLPPSYSSKETLMVFEMVFPTLELLYKREFNDNRAMYQKNLQKILSVVILQNVMPRVTYQYEDLTLYILNLTVELLNELQGASVIHLSRLIFNLGEYVIRNPFFTAFPSIMNETMRLIQTLIDITPEERLKCHNFDLYGLLFIMYEKNYQEGTLSEDRMTLMQEMIIELETKGCCLKDEEKNEIFQHKVEFKNLF